MSPIGIERSGSGPFDARESLLAAKLSLPTTGSPMVPRARLFARLSEGVAGPLTVITGAAGSGKTDLPELRSVQAIALAVPFFLAIYAAAYVTLSNSARAASANR